MVFLSESEWRSRRQAHEDRVRPWIEPRLRRMAMGERHPVEDFLFEYYPYRPGQLLRWHPGLGVTLENAAAYRGTKGYRETSRGLTASPDSLSASRLESIRWMRTLFLTMESRPAALGCFGLHEWAMVYRTESVRHDRWPLRLDAASIQRLVEEQGPRCTHYDAFRFFTPPARPLNRFQPERATAIAFEQPGCLHANMDLYKWAFKLSPFVASELVADCFALAREIRVLDMRASPYDFTGLGLPPVRIETPAGRAAYESSQRIFSQRAAPLRRRLVTACEAILAARGLHPTHSSA